MPTISRFIRLCRLAGLASSNLVVLQIVLLNQLGPCAERATPTVFDPQTGDVAADFRVPVARFEHRDDRDLE
jgi:hypothetical protein